MNAQLIILVYLLHSVNRDAGTFFRSIGQEEVHLGRDADLDTHIEEDGDSAQYEVTEIPGTVFVLGGLALLSRLRDGEEGDDDECHGEYTHSDEQQRGHIRHGGVGRHGSYQNAHQQRSEGAGEGVQGSTNLDELVTTVAAAAQDVEHRVHYGVEHAHAETADEGTQQVYVDGCVTQEAKAGKILDADAHETGGKSNQRCFLVADGHQHLAGGNTHKQICGKIHQVTGHLGPFILVTPDDAEGGGHIGNKRNHREDKTHRDDGYHIGAFLGVGHCVRSLLLVNAY